MQLPDAFCQGYLNVFGKLYDKLPQQMIHRDIHLGNIILSRDHWGFIDFELSEKNIRIYDLCYAATAILPESFDYEAQEKLRKWLEIYQNLVCGYDSVIKLTNEERQAIPYVILANQLVCVAWFSEQEKYADIFETNKGMTLWLLGMMDELRL